MEIAASVQRMTYYHVRCNSVRLSSWRPLQMPKGFVLFRI